MRYPTLPLPEKNPIPHPIDAYFKDWKGSSILSPRKVLINQNTQVIRNG